MTMSAAGAAPVGDQRYIRKMVKGRHHETLGSFFLNHPPLRKLGSSSSLLSRSSVPE
jgi:hypothetical protein